MPMSFLGDLGLQFAGGVLNSVLGKSSADQAFARQKELMNYQMKLQESQFNKYYSPQAQVSNLAAAGINPAVAMGNQSPVFSSVPNGPSPGSVAPARFGIGTTSLTDLANYMLAKANAKKAGVETEGTELDNAVKRVTQDERIKQIGLQNKWTEEQTTKVINEWQKLVGETNILQTESELKKIDLSKHEKLVDGIIDSYLARSNRDKEEANSIKEQLPIILDKLKAEKDILEVDVEIAQDFKGTMSSLGVVGDAVKILLNVIKMFK